MQLLLLFRSTGSRLADFGICGVWTRKLCYVGVFVPWPVGSSWARDRTCVPSVGRWILNHWTTRKAPADRCFGGVVDFLDIELHKLFVNFGD